MDDPDPLWKRIFFNELLLAILAALLVLYVAFHLATGTTRVDDDGRPLTPKSGS